MTTDLNCVETEIIKLCGAVALTVISLIDYIVKNKSVLSMQD